MGVYDTYGKTQLKLGGELMENWEIGDSVPIGDGVYVGLEGVVVVVGGKFIAEFSSLTSKWGDILKPKEVINEHHPFNPILEKVKKK